MSIAKFFSNYKQLVGVFKIYWSSVCKIIYITILLERETKRESFILFYNIVYIILMYYILYVKINIKMLSVL